jgi:hypothetical protein
MSYPHAMFLLFSEPYLPSSSDLEFYKQSEALVTNR